MLLWWLCLFGSCSLTLGAVLDPALYLSPGPPLVSASDDITPEERWTQTLEPRVERDTELLVVPLDRGHESTDTTLPPESEPMEKSETFWMGYRAGSYGLYGMPLTFRTAGTYGRYGTGNSGVVANDYVFSNTRGVSSYGKTGLAGSSYGSYGLGEIGGTRLYGGNSGATWSGWGNGKWGHYGKG